MLLSLIPLAGLAVFLDFAGVRTGKETSTLRIAFLRTVVLLGSYLALVSEGLSLFHALGRWEVAAAWALVVLIAAWFGFRRGWFKTGLSRLFKTLRQATRFEVFLAAGMTVILALLLLIIVKSPTNNLDSLEYHMSRVMHWAQDQSLAHYPTQFEPQLNNPIWSEEAILHIRLLWGDDTLAELVQWFAMIACMLGVSLLAGLLGAGRRGQVAAALFSASIPMAILQATSTQNDYAAAMWLAALLVFTLTLTRGNADRKGESGVQPDPFPKKIPWPDAACLAGALGLGLLTKATFYPIALPVVAWLAWLLIRRFGLAGLFRVGLVIVGIALVLNLGYWARNWVTFASPFGPKALVSNTISVNLAPGGVAAAVTRNVVMNFVTPSSAINAKLQSALVKIFGRYDPGLAGFHINWGWNHEDRAGSPLHLLLVPLSLLALVIYRDKGRRRLWGYAAVSLLVFVALSALLRIDETGVRYQLPFFVSWAPVFGLALEVVASHPSRDTQTARQPNHLPQAVMLALLVLMLPWTLYNRTRSLIAFQDTHDPFTIPCSWGLGCGVRSVLVEPPATLLFTNFTPYRDSYLQMARVIKASGCKAVGLDIDSHDPEYLQWWILDAPQSGVRIETIAPYPELARYVDPAFHPCAIICTTCSLKKTSYHGLPLNALFYGTVLYMGPDYQSAP